MRPLDALGWLAGVLALPTLYFLRSPALLKKPPGGGFFNRRSLCEFERVPVGFLTWFFDPSLQRGIIAELTADWAAGTLENGPVEAYA